MSFNLHKMFNMFFRFCDPTIAALNTYDFDPPLDSPRTLGPTILQV